MKIVWGTLALVLLLAACGNEAPEATTVPAPQVVGLQGVQVAPVLTGAGLTLGATTYRVDAQPAQTVIEQTPAVGVAVIPGTAVAVVLSSGPPEVMETQTSETTTTELSYLCGLATGPGLMLGGWLIAKAGLEDGDPSYFEGFVEDVTDTAQDVRAECPSEVADLSDGVLSATLAYQRKSGTQAEVDEAIKAYWIALSDESDPESAYLEAVEVLG